MVNEFINFENFYHHIVKCGDCKIAKTDPTDDEDIYYCPFDKEYAFHSGEECTHVDEREREEMRRWVFKL